MHAVQLESLTIRYGSFEAVSGVSATFPVGAVGLLGRNGAGKSSILKSILGLVRPYSGRIEVLGRTVEGRGRSNAALRARVGYMPERDAWVSGLNAFETVSLCARLAGLPEGAARRRAHDVLWLVGLGEARYRKVAGYSAGMRQKVKLATALAHDPALLFLDEPTNGLDPAGRQEMVELIGRLVTEFGKSVILSTHILPDVERVCRDVVLLDRGRVRTQGSLESLTHDVHRRYRVTVGGLDPSGDGVARQPGVPAGAGDLAGQLGAVGAECTGWNAEGALVEVELGLPAQASTAAVFAAVQRAGGEVRSLVERRLTLEEVFLQSLGEGGDVGGAAGPADEPAGEEVVR